MRFQRFVVWSGLFGAMAVVVVVALGAAQAPARRSPAAQAASNLNQLMRAVLFVNSNVVFAAQATDPATVKPDAESSTSTNPLTGLYGGWQAVENSSLALVEAANLLILPGRFCENGKPVPTANADWTRFVDGLRAAGMASYKAARSKNQDAMLEAADGIVTACGNCHEVYRDKGTLGGHIAARCVK
jgi:cytochrome c553